MYFWFGFSLVSFGNPVLLYIRYYIVRMCFFAGAEHRSHDFEAVAHRSISLPGRKVAGARGVLTTKTSKMITGKFGHFLNRELPFCNIIIQHPQATPRTDQFRGYFQTQVLGSRMHVRGQANGHLEAPG